MKIIFELLQSGEMRVTGYEDDVWWTKTLPPPKINEIQKFGHAGFQFAYVKRDWR